jgi:hypothetical protein
MLYQLLVHLKISISEAVENLKTLTFPRITSSEAFSKTSCATEGLNLFLPLLTSEAEECSS